MHQHLGRVVLGGEGGFEHGVDPARVGLLHHLGLLGDVEQRAKILLRLRQGGQHRIDAAVDQVVDDLLCVSALLAGLFLKKCGESGEVVDGAPDRHRLIAMGGGELVVELALKLGYDAGRNGRSGHRDREVGIENPSLHRPRGRLQPG